MVEFRRPKLSAPRSFTVISDVKVADVRALTDSAPPPSFFSAPSGCTLVNFRSLTVDDVAAAIQLLPDKQCASDPIC